MRIEIVPGDITKAHADAIVNAANPSLLGGGGVDGAIHRAAGPELLNECRALNGCKTGEAKITGGYALPARYVIHTPGPVWQGGSGKEDELLAGSYLHSLQLAESHECKSVAFPSISTGIYGFPPKRAARIATRVIYDFLRSSRNVGSVQMVCFDAKTLGVYQTALAELVFTKYRALLEGHKTMNDAEIGSVTNELERDCLSCGLVCRDYQKYEKEWNEMAQNQDVIAASDYATAVGLLTYCFRENYWSWDYAKLIQRTHDETIPRLLTRLCVCLAAQDL